MPTRPYWKTTTSFGGPYKDNAWWVNPPHNAGGAFTGEPDSLYRSPTKERHPFRQALSLCRNFGRLSLPEQSILSRRRPIAAAGTSYSITGLMHGESRTVPSVPISIPRSSALPAKIVFVENTDNRGWIMGSWMMSYQWSQPGWIDLVSDDALGNSGLSFADGHGEIHAWNDKITIDMGE